MTLNPFRETEERIAAGGLGAGLVRNADPLTDPNGNVHRLYPSMPPDSRARPVAIPNLPAATEVGERLGSWANLVLFVLIPSLAVLFLAISLPDRLPAVLAEQQAAIPLDPMRADHPVRPDPAPPPNAPAAGISLSTSPPPTAEPDPAPSLPPAPPIDPTLPVANTGALLSRGEVLLDAGEIAAARPMLARAAMAGSGEAALRLGQSYDPAFFRTAGRREASGNLGLAIFWYRRGRDLGNGKAAFLARQLETEARAGWRAAILPASRPLAVVARRQPRAVGPGSVNLGR